MGGAFYGSPVCVDNRLYCIAKNGEVVVLAAADKFEVLARVPLGEPSFATPAVAGGVMYLRTRSHLFSLGGAGKAALRKRGGADIPLCPPRKDWLLRCLGGKVRPISLIP